MSSFEDPSPPLKVTVVGAGIGGLAVAVSLRREGHIVEVFEASQIKTEVGAGIGVQVNALRVLEHLGVVRENLRGVTYDGITSFDSQTGECLNATPWLLGEIDQNRSITCHRSDVHEELRRIACADSDSVEGTPVKLHLGNKVVDCDPEEATITLANGKTVKADLVVAADGVHSTIRASILGYPQPALPSGISCFRMVFDASKLKEIPDVEWFTEGLAGIRGLVLKGGGEYGMIGSYYCRDKTLVNLAALYEDPSQEDPGTTWSSVGTREELIARYPTVHAKFLAFLGLGESPILKWQLRVLPVLPTWIKGRAMLLGDAAHATLPTLGQGAALAIEEAGALGCLLPRGTKKEDIPRRLEGFQTLRKPRGDFINREAIEQVTVPEKRGLYFRSEKVQGYFIRHKAIQEAQEYYEEHFGS